MAKPRHETIDLEPTPGLDHAPEPARAGGAFGVIGWLSALLWLAAAAACAYAFIGVDGLLQLAPPALAALGMLSVLPALLILFAAAAAREGARARAEAARLADAADRLFNPSPSAEASARRLGVSVRGEIAALDRALEHVSQKLREVEAVIARQTLAVDNAAEAASAGARQMVTGLERERNDLLQIADELHGQAKLIGEAISRHTRMIADAARVAEAEVRAADEALDSRLSSFGAAAALISDRTSALNDAARSSAEAALRLETALSTSLDALAKATTLTDASRQSAEAATLAANATAGAIRDTTQRAVEEARRAAEVIRAEAAALDRMRETGGAPPPSALRDLAPEPAPQPAPTRKQPASFLGVGRRQPAEEPRRAAPATPRPGDPGFADSLSAPQRPSQDKPAAPPPSGAGVPDSRWTWRDVLASVESDDADAKAQPAATPRAKPVAGPEPEPQRERAPPQPAAERRIGRPLVEGRAAPQPQAPPQPQPQPQPAAPRAGDPATHASEVRLRSVTHGPGQPPSGAPGVAILEAAGVRLSDTFSLSALERISQKARGGTQSRRRAVREAVPDAVLRLANHLDKDAAARAEAAEFLKGDGARIAELLGRGRASMSADATRAFLLLDAAAA